MGDPPTPAPSIGGGGLGGWLLRPVMKVASAARGPKGRVREGCWPSHRWGMRIRSGLLEPTFNVVVTGGRRLLACRPARAAGPVRGAPLLFPCPSAPDRPRAAPSWWGGRVTFPRSRLGRRRGMGWAEVVGYLSPVLTEPRRARPEGRRRTPTGSSRWGPETTRAGADGVRGNPSTPALLDAGWSACGHGGRPELCPAQLVVARRPVSGRTSGAWQRAGMRVWSSRVPFTFRTTLANARP